jgi:hypothetical protein
MSIDLNEPLYPKSARPEGDPRKVDGKKGSETSHGLIDNNESIFDIAKNKVASKSLKHHDSPTIGSQQYDGGKSATNFTKGFDPKNIAGAIPFALNLVKDIQSNSGAGKLLGDIVGGNIGPMIQQFLGALKSGDQKAIGDLVSKIQSEYENKK